MILFLLVRTAEVAGGFFLLSTWIYVAVSYLVASRHHPRIKRSIFLREAFREFAIAVLTQPFLPIFYWIGRRLGNGNGVPLVMVHGYMQNRIDFVYLSRFLSRRGFGPIFGVNYWSLGPVESSAKTLADFVESVCKETGASHIDLVCHSWGGLVAGEYLKTHAERVRRCVTIASPHAGISWPGPVLGRAGRAMRKNSEYLKSIFTRSFGVPILSIFSTFDNVVYPRETSALAHRGGEDVIVDEVGHLAILFDRRTALAVARFLEVS